MGNKMYSQKKRENVFTTPEKSNETSSDELSPLERDFQPSACTVTHLPAEITKSWTFGREPLAIVIDNVLSEAECALWIAETERVGYGEALVNIGGGRQQKMTDIRNSSRCIVDSVDRAAGLWRRVQPFVPTGHVPGKVASELNERLRFLRYDPGEYFAPHLDGSYSRETGHPRFGETSYLTLQLYLNEGFEGGATRFFHRRDDHEVFDVVPRTGSVLIFDHRMLHSGERLISGRKYAVRSDIMFKRTAPPGKEDEEDDFDLESLR